jgi:anthranilate phosphoribosyltransferase
MLNPAQCAFQLVGVYDPRWLEVMALTLNARGVQNAVIVHGSDGMDEFTVTGNSVYVYLRNGEFLKAIKGDGEATNWWELNPKQVGLGIHSLDSLRGGDAAHNAQAMRDLFEKAAPSAYRDIVVLNAAAALVGAGLVQDMSDAVIQVSNVLVSGAVAKKLNEFVAYTNDVATKLTFMATNDTLS